MFNCHLLPSKQAHAALLTSVKGHVTEEAAMETGTIGDGSLLPTCSILSMHSITKGPVGSRVSAGCRLCYKQGGSATGT